MLWTQKCYCGGHYHRIPHAPSRPTSNHQANLPHHPAWRQQQVTEHSRLRAAANNGLVVLQSECFDGPVTRHTSSVSRQPCQARTTTTNQHFGWFETQKDQVQISNERWFEKRGWHHEKGTHMEFIILISFTTEGMLMFFLYSFFYQC